MIILPLLEGFGRPQYLHYRHDMLYRCTCVNPNFQNVNPPKFTDHGSCKLEVDQPPFRWIAIPHVNLKLTRKFKPTIRIVNVHTFSIVVFCFWSNVFPLCTKWLAFWPTKTWFQCPTRRTKNQSKVAENLSGVIGDEEPSNSALSVASCRSTPQKKVCDDALTLAIRSYGCFQK